MNEKITVTIDREYGSDGHDIGQKHAERLGIDFYDDELIARAREVFAKFKETHPPKEITEDDLKDWDSYE